MDCPNCKLVNPPDAERCDCGYDFRTRTLERSYLTEPSKQKEPVHLYTHLKVLAILSPVFFLIAFLGNKDLALQGIADLLIMLGAVGLLELVFSKDPS